MLRRIIRLLAIVYLSVVLYAAIGYVRRKLNPLPEETYTMTSPAFVLQPRPTPLPMPGVWQPLERPYTGFESRYSGSGFDRKEGSTVLASTSIGYILYVNSQNQLLRFQQNRPAKLIGSISAGSVIQTFKAVPSRSGDHILFLLTNKTLTVSYDHGDNWADITPENDDVLQSIAIAPEPDKDDLFIAAISNDRVFVSADSGRSWILVNAVLGLHPFYDVEILTRPGSIRLFIVGRTGLTSLAWPTGIPEKVRNFGWRHIEAIYRGNLRTTDDQAIYVFTRGLSLGGGMLEALLGRIFEPQAWRLNDSGVGWERLTMPDIPDLYYPFGYTEVTDKKSNAHVALAPLASGDLVISRNRQRWTRVKLGTKLLLADTTIGSAGPLTVFGISDKDELIVIDVDKKTWSAVQVPLSTLMSVKLAVGTTKNNKPYFITSSRKRLLISEDEGQSWQLLGMMPEGTEAITLAPSPAYEDDETIYVGASHGLYLFNSHERKFTQNAKLGDEAVHTIYFSPLFYTDTSLYVGTGSGIFRSADGGQHWNRLSNGIGVIEVNSIVRSRRGDLFAGTRRGVYVSSDAGNSWVKPKNLLSDKSVLVMAARDGQDGHDFILAGTADGAYLSSNKGATWKRMDLPTGTMTISSILITSKANDDFVVYLGTVGGGVVISRDNAKTWQLMRTAEGGLQIWDLVIAQQNPLMLIAGTLNRSLWIYREPGANTSQSR